MSSMEPSSSNPIVANKNVVESFKLGMRQLGSGVCVISVNAPADRFAMTATSVTSLSMAPPSLLVCVNRQASINNQIKDIGRFCVNILADEQQAVSDLCADPNKQHQRFNNNYWEEHQQLGSLLIKDCLASFTCDLIGQHEYGSHTIFIGEVVDVQAESTNKKGLSYRNGQYASL